MKSSALLSIREFAASLGVTERRTRLLAASGRIQGALKIGRDWLIPASARVTAGSRGPPSRASRRRTRAVLSANEKAQALKRERQRRFRRRAMRSPSLAIGAVAVRLPREAVRFREPDLETEDLL